MFNLKASVVVAVALFPLLVSSSVFAQSSSTLAGGANSLSESYQDWKVNCVVHAESGKQCAMIQQQFQAQTNQRILAVELRWSEEGSLEGAIVMPFGLLLGVGAKLDVDKTGVMMSRAFSTCLAGGCLVPISFDSNAIQRMRLGSVLYVSTRQVNNENIDFSISLAGFSNALNRLIELDR